MTEPEIVVRKATDEDLDAVAKLHRRMFREQFLGHFPASILRRFYKCFLPVAVFVIAYDEKRQLLGFVMGGRTEELDRARDVFLQRNVLGLAAFTFVSPGLWRHAWHRLMARFGSKESQPAGSSTTSHRLLSIAVSPESQGRGVAGKLVVAFESELTDAQEYGLSVESENERAIGFYHKLGMHLDGEWGSSVFFRKSLSTTSSDNGAATNG